MNLVSLDWVTKWMSNQSWRWAMGIENVISSTFTYLSVIFFCNNQMEMFRIKLEMWVLKFGKEI